MKQLLEENRIYLDLILPILIGIAALFITVASYLVSKQQLQLNDIQNSPHFYVETNYIFNPENSKYDQIEMSVFNYGALVNNLNFSVKSILIVDYEKKSGRKKVNIPIIGYYPNQINQQSPSGKLVTFMGHKNNIKFHELNNKFLLEELRSKYGFVNLDIENIITITYKNRKYEDREAYFLNENLVNKKDLDHKLQAYDSTPILDFETLTTKKIMEILLEYEK